MSTIYEAILEATRRGDSVVLDDRAEFANAENLPQASWAILWRNWPGSP